MDLDQRLEPELHRTRHQARQPPGRMQDSQQQHEVRSGGPQQGQLARIDDEVLGEDRDATAARTARRSSTEPPNQCGSHRTEMTAAPPAS